MKITIISCDVCKSEIDVTSYRINNGKFPDASGNGYEIEWGYRDLCFTCFKNWILKNPTRTSDIKKV